MVLDRIGVIDGLASRVEVGRGEVGREGRDVPDEKVLLAAIEREAAFAQAPQQPVRPGAHPVEQASVERIKGALRKSKRARDARELSARRRAPLGVSELGFLTQLQQS